MGPNIEPCGIPDKSIWKKTQCHLFLHSAFYGLSMNAQNLLHPLINHMHEALQQLNHEEHSQKARGDP